MNGKTINVNSAVSKLNPSALFATGTNAAIIAPGHFEYIPAMTHPEAEFSQGQIILLPLQYVIPTKSLLNKFIADPALCQSFD